MISQSVRVDVMVSESVRVDVLMNESNSCTMESIPSYAYGESAQNLGTYRCASPIRKGPSPHDLPRTLGIGLRQGPRGVRFLMTSEVPLYSNRDGPLCSSPVTVY